MRRMGSMGVIMNKMPKEELHILRHSLGLRPGQNGYRNYFVTGKGSRDYPVCETLVRKGYMTKNIDPLNEMEREYVYRVTESGKRVAKEEARE